MKPAAFVAVLFLGLIAIVHLCRLVFRVEVSAGGADIPIWASVIAVVGPAALAIWLWREQRS